jgi:hypothetical protein
VNELGCHPQEASGRKGIGEFLLAKCESGRRLGVDH